MLIVRNQSVLTYASKCMHRDITGDHPNFTDSHIAVKTVIRKVWEWSGKDTY